MKKIMLIVLEICALLIFCSCKINDKKEDVQENEENKSRETIYISEDGKYKKIVPIEQNNDYYTYKIESTVNGHTINYSCKKDENAELLVVIYFCYPPRDTSNDDPKLVESLLAKYNYNICLDVLLEYRIPTEIINRFVIAYIDPVAYIILNTVMEYDDIEKYLLELITDEYIRKIDVINKPTNLEIEELLFG